MVQNLLWSKVYLLRVRTAKNRKGRKYRQARSFLKSLKFHKLSNTREILFSDKPMNLFFSEAQSNFRSPCMLHNVYINDLDLKLMFFKII